MTGNPFSSLGVSDEELAEQLRKSGEIDAALNAFMRDEVVPYWKSVSPVRTGQYAASVKVIKKARNGKGEVGATHFTAHWIEYGTGEPGPTPVFAPGEKTAHHFGGTLEEGVTFEEGDDER